MHSERANEAAADQHSGGEQGKPGFVCDDSTVCCKPAQIDAAFLNDQLQANGIVLTKLQIPQWSPNIFEQAQHSIINTFCLGQQPILGKQLVMANEKALDGKQQEIFNHASIFGHLKRASLVPIKGDKGDMMANYNSINGSDATLNSTYSIYHINNGYISSDAQSLDYGDYGDQNPHQSQLPINETGSNHDDSTKAAVKELFFPVMFR